MRIAWILFAIVQLLTRAAGAEEMLTERTGTLLDVDWSRDAIVLGSGPKATTAVHLQTDSDTVVFKEIPEELNRIGRGTSLSVTGRVDGNRIQAARLTALAVAPEEGRYKNTTLGRLERREGRHILLVNDAAYLLVVENITTVLRHKKAVLEQLQPGQSLVVTVEQKDGAPPRARQIIFKPSDEEKLEKDQILL